MDFTSSFNRDFGISVADFDTKTKFNQYQLKGNFTTLFNVSYDEQNKTTIWCNHSLQKFQYCNHNVIDIAEPRCLQNDRCTVNTNCNNAIHTKQEKWFNPQNHFKDQSLQLWNTSENTLTNLAETISYFDKTEGIIPYQLHCQSLGHSLWYRQSPVYFLSSSHNV